ncbi:MAG: Mu-like prophage major head subunit gpT family protein [Proteobacteria bacterium]|nr:Mu-like prophage major head subunit gpT family protein [Pseudomonadota bacterium]MBU1387098.1 Mu-like prophage major head subunit gpT family protein [Pseudomonadota bacterium]MBU1541585.1 Mu-like prophage major head subunit gpT family protein [Pseudomonadota bacterium]MBU2429531.1 Mu-like prophage major head subunit gpT family protein [Pseudomonadota bacterium]MBU2482542.1 Mu-like prophage major head subunit gpT family protein [Pseudomonadota bacterium]
MLVNKANISAVFITLKTIFNKAFDAAPSIWEKTTMKVPSGGSQNDYSWLGRFPKMRKWLGDKVFRKLAAHKYTIVNDDWEATVEVDRNDIDDDNIGIYAPMAQDAGFSAKQLPDEIDADLKNNAFVSKCFDGQYFYDTDHPVTDINGRASSVSNKGTAVLSAATKTLAAAGYGAARLAIMSYKDDEGRPLGLVPDLLEVGPALESTAKMLCESDKLEDDKPNPYKGTATYVVNPRLTSSTQWMLHVTNRPIKPFIYQERKAPVFVSMTDIETETVFKRKKFLFGAEARAAGGYGLWPLSYGSTGLG